jgi:predicted amidohydrolase
VNVAAAQTRPVPGDVEANVVEHVRLIGEAAAAGARVVVFGELSLTGYEPDLIATDPALWLTPDDARLDPLRDACRTQRIHAVVGAPVRDGERRILAAIAIDDAGDVAAVYAKHHLDEVEDAVFQAGGEHVVLPIDGHRIGLSVCADASVPEHAAQLAALGADGYFVGALFPRGTEDRRLDQMSSRARDHGLWVVLGSLEGPAGPYVGSGGSGIWGPNGRAVVQLGDEPAGIAVTEMA